MWYSIQKAVDTLLQLKKYRRKAGLTQQELADETGIDRATIVRYENGSRTPPLENLKILAKYFDISIDKLTGTAEPTVPDDDDIKFAVFGDPDVTDAQFDEIKQFAKWIRERDKKQ
jgi:transcriptional regulator with XRE-family HTH domain